MRWYGHSDYDRRHSPYSYLWSNGQTTQTGTNLCSGNNFVQVTDANGCVVSVCVKVGGGTFTATLNSPTYAGGVNIRCNGGLDGSINLTTNPQGAYTYTWSSGATTEDLMGVGAGTYTVTVSNGVCTQTVSITLTEPAALTATASGTNVNCNGNNNGTATVAAMGGVSPYSYSWSNGQTTVTATGLMAGTYTVTVTDANGCTATASYVVTAPVNGLNITETHVNPTCNGSSNGSINITVTGGTAPYTYIWTGGATTEDRTGLAAGSHTVTVTDANGCTITLCVVLTQPSAIVLSQSCTNTTCNNGSNGASSVAAAGGTAPYTYVWNNFETTSSISNLPAGTYTVTVTDANGCSNSSSCVITAPTSIVVVVDSTSNVTNYGGNNGAAYISVSGGGGTYTYQWNTIPVRTTQDVIGLTAGTFQVTVTDGGGCLTQASVTITQPPYVCSNGSPFHTEFPNPGTYGNAQGWTTPAAGNNIGTYLTNHFPAAFPASLVVGGGCGGSRTLTLSSSTAVRNFLTGQPGTGGATILTSNLNNPTSTTFNSSFAALVVSLKMSVVFDAYDPNFAPVPTVTLGDLIYNTAPFAGMTVTQVLNEANKKLGGCSSPYLTSACSTAVWNILRAWAGGAQGSTAGMLTCPAPPKMASGIASTSGLVTIYPNPSEGMLNMNFEASEDGKLRIVIYDHIGRIVFVTEEAAFAGSNIRSYDLTNLASGMYLVNVQLNGMTETGRLIKK
ncbi:MAG: T9SS type A sorting domain-containing protein [Bacteroidetes bacterium]|nr:T9SS type A sorting domain-containing protein [Bacteroidota bacterium]